jgi:hypothetical protein
MLLTIDAAKVRESLANARKPSYVATASHLVAVEPPPVPPPLSTVGGTTMFGATRSDKDMRDLVMSVRRRIEESGVPLKSASELDKEIDEMRGRSR